MQIGFGLGSPGCAARGAARAPRNFLANSWQFNGSEWGGPHSSIGVTTGQPDPRGGNKAVLCTSLGAASKFYQILGKSYPLSALQGASRICVSCHYKLGAGGAFADGNLRFYNATIGSAAGGLTFGGYNVDASGVFTPRWTSGDGTSDTNLIVADKGNGWYRVSYSIDLDYNRANEGWQETDSCSVRLMLWSGDETAGRELYIFGCQVEPGAAPGRYKEKP